jgi:phage head maturation protease
MKKFSFIVDVVADELDRDGVVDSISSCLTDALPSDVHANVKAGEVKAFSEQGYKVWRARVTGVTAKQAGDAHNGKVEAEAEAVA